MKVIVGCEFSGVVRDAFIKRGHDAWSCDLLPCETGGNHLQGDIFDYINDDWDLGIFHPPCTFLCSSGIHWNARIPGRDNKTDQAIDFVKRLYYSGINKIAIENPVGVLSSRFRKPDQIIQPWQFGHPESKATCFWLKRLPVLMPTVQADFRAYKCRCGNVFPVEAGKYGCCQWAARPLWYNQTNTGQNRLCPSADRWKLRSITYQGIADAMAQQWG